MTAIEALAVAFAQERLHQAMAFEKFTDSKAPEHIHELEYLLEQFDMAMDYYKNGYGRPDA